MNIILIDPDKRAILDCPCDGSQAQFDALVGGNALPIWIVPAKLVGHVGLVDEMGIKKKLRVWYFDDVHIWGPMLIYVPTENIKRVSIETVKALIDF